MFVKICGMTNVEDAALAVALGADAVGFIFAPSKRRVTAEQVAPIAARLPAGVEKVGVLDATDAEEIARTVRTAGLTGVQLHSAHDAALTLKLHALLGTEFKLLQVMAIEAGAQDAAALRAGLVDPLRKAMADPAVWAVLLDTAKAGVSGGTGTVFSWEQAKPAIREALALAMAERRAPVRLLLAGGLHAANVGEAITVLSPWGVDVSSGVEASPGRKDPERLAAFLDAAKGAGSSLRG